MSVIPAPIYPTYEIVIPSLKKKVKYRPYIAREEKVLTIALESKDPEEMINAIKIIIKNCIQTKDIDVDKLAVFDIEYLFLNIRAKAAGEEIDLQVLYPDGAEEGEDDLYIRVKLNVSDIKVIETKGHTNIVDLGNDMKLFMKYPSFDYFVNDQFMLTDVEKMSLDEKFDKGYEVLASCVDKICYGEDVWLSDDVGREEVVDFLWKLTSKQLEKLQNFLDTMPQMKHEIKLKHPTRTVIVEKTGEEVPEETKITLNGIIDFFI
jgi:hypothetical protein